MRDEALAMPAIQKPQQPRGALNWGSYVLAEAGVDSPRYDAQELLCHVLGVDHLVKANNLLTSGQWQQYLELIGRRAQRQPLQHLLGYMYFRHLKLHSKPGVFITRPETEILVDTALDILEKLQGHAGNTLRVVDLCSGSGAIALSLASEAPHVTVWAVEKDRTAFELSAQHVREQKLQGVVTLVQGDATTPEILGDLDGSIDLVVSNPPYLHAEITQPEALADPQEALWGEGYLGLDIPTKIIGRAAKLLRVGGELVMEHDPQQVAHLQTAAISAGFDKPRVVLDLNGCERFLRAKKLPPKGKVAP
ncbi:MAG: peptide chain release factor N(5)-glutamine methyltransferase [Actinomycetaceae bacterium]|nr:peptide chain release factor N(5)-glutamine methyltransferase [Actinomycetaceae bacterium]